MVFIWGTTIVVLTVSVAAIPPVAHLSKGNGIAIPIYTRAPTFTTGDTVNFEAVGAHMASVRAKIARGLENYESNTGTTHPSAARWSGNQKRNINANGAGTELTGWNDGHLWYCTLTIGTPPKPFTVEIDTGSSDFYVPRADCGPTCLGHTLWNPTLDSRTATALRAPPFHVRYADRSSVFGYFYADNVTFADITADNQTIGAARLYSPRLAKTHFPPDGMLGMGFGSLATSRAKTLVETLIAENKLPEKAFSVRLTPTGGELWLGGSNEQLHDDFTFTKVTHESYWKVVLEGIEGKTGRLLSNIDVAIDTGATHIAGDPARVKQLHEKLGGKLFRDEEHKLDYYIYPCLEFPSVGFIFGGRSFEIPSEIFNIGRVDDNSPDCASAIYGVETGASFWIVGGSFLQSVYTKFDFGNLQVGFADLKSGPVVA